MIGRKDLVIAVLLTFCLTTVLFMILPTRSQYDPWVDTNEDGAVDSSDLGTLGSAWGTFGDPAKNVIIANHTTTHDTIFFTIPSANGKTVSIETNGYKEIDCGFMVSNNVGCTVYWVVGIGIKYVWESLDLVPSSTLFKVYAVHGWNITLVFGNTNISPVNVFIDYYMST